jgi:hypothetical protein
MQTGIGGVEVTADRVELDVAANHRAEVSLDQIG